MTGVVPYDLGRMVMRIQVTASLKSMVDLFDVPAIVEDVVQGYGFVDIGELSAEKYWGIVWSHKKQSQ